MRIRHFVFKDGTEITHSYAKGDNEALRSVNDQHVQDENFPDRFFDPSDKREKYTNPLIRVFETEG